MKKLETKGFKGLMEMAQEKAKVKSAGEKSLMLQKHQIIIK